MIPEREKLDLLANDALMVIIIIVVVNVATRLDCLRILFVRNFREQNTKGLPSD